MKIAIASGKGGTGKTSISVSLFSFLSEKYVDKVQLVDCDVEEPNVLLFMPNAKKRSSRNEYTIVPEIDTTRCTFCKLCAEWCTFNAISVVKSLEFAEVNTDLCHSCGVCSHACSSNAISTYKKPLGEISYYEAGGGSTLIEGRLEIGSALQTSLIKKVKNELSANKHLTIIDSPPGTSCSVVETLSNTDYVILVGEPTPFGLNDLKITVELLHNLHLPFGVIINKANLGNHAMYDFIEKQNIELLGSIPFSENYARNYSNGQLMREMPNTVFVAYQQIMEQLIKKIELR